MKKEKEVFELKSSQKNLVKSLDNKRIPHKEKVQVPNRISQYIIQLWPIGKPNT